MNARETGFSLLTAAMASLLISILALLFSLQVALHWDLAGDVDSQLYSLVLAENGIAFARSQLPGEHLDSLLSGTDQRHCGDKLPEWRSPMPFEKALSVDPASWVPACDDGLLVRAGPPWGYAAAGPGYYFLRISNNPEEPPEADFDHEVLIRSLGVVPNKRSLTPREGALNSTALVEARVRQETAFFLPSPLTLFGDSGFFDWEGAQFSVDSGQSVAVSMIEVPGSALVGDFVSSLSPLQQRLFHGSGFPLSLQDATALFRRESSFRRLFRSDFWRHFLARLPEFSASLPGGVEFFPNGAILDSPFAGVLITQGDVTLKAGAQINGLLLHLGEGGLSLLEGSEVVGAIWMSNLDLQFEEVQAGSIFLHGSGRFRIRYDEQVIRDALALLPTTLLGWRILFPETVQ